MSEIPNRKLTAQELKQFKKEQELKKLLNDVEFEYTRRSEEPSKWFGRLLAALVIALFLDITGWIGAFIDGGLYAIFARLLQFIETVSIIGLAALAIYGSIESYKHQQELKKVAEEFERTYQG